MWNNINSIRENNHEEELNRMKEEGASQEEIDERKKEIAREDLKRQKRIKAHFKQLLILHPAIVGFLQTRVVGLDLAVCYGWCWVHTNSRYQFEPLPAFEVGSIRIPPETQEGLSFTETK